MTATEKQKRQKVWTLSNRMANARNEFQGPRRRVLCLCTAGMLRSPTAAWILSNEPFGFNTRAAGLDDSCCIIPVDKVLLSWADEFVVMAQEHKDVLVWKLKTLAPEIPLQQTNIHVLNVPDQFEFREPKLVELMTEKLLVLFGHKEPNPVTPFAHMVMPHELLEKD